MLWNLLTAPVFASDDRIGFQTRSRPGEQCLRHPKWFAGLIGVRSRKVGAGSYADDPEAFLTRDGCDRCTLV